MHCDRGKRPFAYARRECFLAAEYWIAFWQRRWTVLSAVFLVILLLSSLLAIREISDRTWIATDELFVSSLPYSSAAAGISYEAEASRVAQDLAQIAISRSVSVDMLGNPPLRAYNLSVSSIQHNLSASANGRTVTVSASAPSEAEAILIDNLTQVELVQLRLRYLGPFEGGHSAVQVISSPSATRASLGHIAETWLLRVLLGLVVAIALALVWEYFDETVHDVGDLERWLDVPVLARVS